MKQILSLFMFGIGALLFLAFFATLRPTDVTAIGGGLAGLVSLSDEFASNVRSGVKGRPGISGARGSASLLKADIRPSDVIEFVIKAACIL
jgi:hypothetical protein